MVFKSSHTRVVKSEPALYCSSKEDRYFLLLVIVLVAALCYLSSAPANLILPVCVMAILCIIPVAHLFKPGKHGVLLNPAIIFCGTFWVIYGLGALNSYETQAARLTLVANINFEDSMPRAVWWACAGLLSFFVGYYSGWGEKLSALIPPLPQRSSLSKVRKLCVFSIILALIRYSSFYLGLRNLTSFLDGFDLLAVAALTIIAFNEDPPEHGLGSKRWHVAVAVIVFSFPGLLSGFRGLFVLTSIISLVTLYWVTKRFPWRIFIPFCIGIYLVVLPITGFYKVARLEQGLSITESINYTINELEIADFSFNSGEQQVKFKERMSIMPIFTTIVELTGETVPYQEGSTYLNFVYNFVPRFLWNDKPVLNEFSNSLPRQYGIIDANDERTSVGLGLLGETWINFGAAGVILIMAIYGIIYRFLFDWILVKSNFSSFACAVYMPILWQLSLQENVFVNNIGAISKFLILVWFSERLLLRRAD